MRVLMTTDGVGGVWQYSLALARGLVARHGCAVALVCIGEPPAGDLEEAIPGGGVELFTLRLKLEWMPDSAGDVREALRQVGRLAAAWRPDVIHSNQFCFGLLDVAAPRVVVAHSDLLGWMAWHRGWGKPGSGPDSPAEPRVEQRGMDEPTEKQSTWPAPGLQLYRNLVAAGLAGAAAVVSPSRFMAMSLARSYGRRSRVIYNGLWPDLYPSLPKENVAALVGRLWDEAKNAAVAARAAAGLPLELRLVGPTVGPSGETTYLPSAANVRYTGRLSWAETRASIARARFYLAASSYEPFGLAALEAAFCGCALLASDTPAHREMWEGAALFYHRDDERALRRHLSALLEVPEEAERLSRAARDRALERFTAERMAAEYHGLYTSILEPHGARSGRGSGSVPRGMASSGVLARRLKTDV